MLVLARATRLTRSGCGWQHQGVFQVPSWEVGGAKHDAPQANGAAAMGDLFDGTPTLDASSVWQRALAAQAFVGLFITR